jgi:hypothetical protein
MADNTGSGVNYIKGVLDEISQLTARPGGFVSDDKGGSGGGVVPIGGSKIRSFVPTDKQIGIENMPQPITLNETSSESPPILPQPTIGGVTGQNPSIPVTPTIPAVTQTMATEKSTPPTEGWWTKEGWGVSGKGGQTPLGSQPTATRITRGTEAEPATLLEAQGIRELQKSPEQIAREQQIVSGGATSSLRVDTSGIDSRISAIQRDPNMQAPGGGLKGGAINQIVELEKAKQTAITGSEGHGVTAQGHKVAAEASMDYRKSQLEATRERNQLLHQDLQLKLSQQKDIAAQKALETSLSRFAVHEADPMNPTDKAVNMRATYFNVFDSGTKPHPSIADAVGQVGNEYKTYRDNTMKLSKVNTLTPEEEKQIKARFRKSITLYPDITTKK